MALRVLRRRGEQEHPYVRIFAETIRVPSLLWSVAGALTAGFQIGDVVSEVAGGVARRARSTRARRRRRRLASRRR